MVPHGFQCNSSNVNEVCKQCPGYSEDTGGHCLYAGDDFPYTSLQDVEDYTECLLYKQVELNCV
jgi:hypothetical protein